MLLDGKFPERQEEATFTSLLIAAKIVEYYQDTVLTDSYHLQYVPVEDSTALTPPTTIFFSVFRRLDGGVGTIVWRFRVAFVFI